MASDTKTENNIKPTAASSSSITESTSSASSVNQPSRDPLPQTPPASTLNKNKNSNKESIEPTVSKDQVAPSRKRAYRQRYEIKKTNLDFNLVLKKFQIQYLPYIFQNFPG